MGMSTYVIGFVPPDERWHQMKAAWDACMVAGVPIPNDVRAFFGGEEPDDRGREITQGALEQLGAVRDWHGGGMGSGYEVEVSKLPPEVKVVRFCNSW